MTDSSGNARDASSRNSREPTNFRLSSQLRVPLEDCPPFASRNSWKDLRKSHQFKKEKKIIFLFAILFYVIMRPFSFLITKICYLPSHIVFSVINSMKSNVETLPLCHCKKVMIMTTTSKTISFRRLSTIQNISEFCHLRVAIV